MRFAFVMNCKAGNSISAANKPTCFYDGIYFEEALRCDVFVDETIIVELKAVDQMNTVWEAQVLSHLKLSNKHVGFLVNFNVALIRDGIRR